MKRDKNPCPCGCDRTKGTHIRALHLTDADVEYARLTHTALPTLCGTYGVPGDVLSTVERTRRRGGCGCCLHLAVRALLDVGVIGPKAEVGR